jgi:hypothetical protein
MFNKKQAENPSFYYSFNLDSEEKIRRFFGDTEIKVIL